MRKTFAVLLLFALATAPGAARSVEPRQSQAYGRMQAADLLAKFLAPDEKPLIRYRALRTLTATTRGGKLTASLQAWTSLDPEHGFTFQVVSEEGSPIIRRKVLLAALEAEQAAQGGRNDAALTAANYEFVNITPVPVNLVRVDVKPRRKHMMLVDGSLFLEPDSADLVRIEGELSRRPSVWTRNVRVLREYSRIAGVHVPVAMSSTADVLIVGSSSFSMTYRYTEINGVSVDSR